MTAVYIIGGVWLALVAWLVVNILRADTMEAYAEKQRRKAIRRRRRQLAKNVIAAERLDELFRQAQERDSMQPGPDGNRAAEGEEHDGRDH